MQSSRAQVLRTLAINGLAPYLVYRFVHVYTGSFVALICAAVPPLVENVWTVLRRRRLDALGALVLAGIGLGLLMITLGGGPRLLLVRESLITGGIGAAFLGSVPLPRPLVFYLGREAVAGEDPESLESWYEAWTLASVRRGIRVITLGWGLGLVLEATVRIYLAETMAIGHFLAVSPFVQYGAAGALGLGTAWYAGRLRHAADAERGAQAPDHPEAS